MKSLLGPRYGRRRILLLYLLLAVLATAPGSLLLPWSLIGSPAGDMQQHVWSLWWNVEAPVFRWQSPLHTQLLDFPTGGALYPIDVMGVVTTTPLFLLLPAKLFPTAVLAYNLRVLFDLVLAAWGGFLLATTCGCRKIPAVVAGAAYAFCPYMLGSLENGVSELFGLGWIALALWGLDRALRDPRALLPAAALTAAALLTNWYYAAALAVLIPLWLAFRALEGGARGWRTVLLAGLLAVSIVGPFYQGFRAYLASPDLLSSHPVGGRALRDIAPAELTAWFRPGKDAPVPEWPYRHVTYLGYAPLVLGALALRRRAGWFWLAVGSGFLALSLGPALTWELEPQPGLDLPFARLAAYAPFLGGMNFPYRLVAVSALAVALLAGLGLSQLPLRRRAQARMAVLALGAILVEGWLLSPAPWPLSTTDARIPPSVRAVRAESRGLFGVCPLPWWSETLPSGGAPEAHFNRVRYKATWGRYFVQATVHGGGLPYGVRDQVPEWLRQNRLGSWFDARDHGSPRVPSAMEIQAGAADLAARGYRWLLIDPTVVRDPDEVRAALTNALGAPVAGDAWDLVPADAEGSRGALLGSFERMRP